MLLGAVAWGAALLLGASAAHRRSRDNAGRYLPLTVRRFDRQTGTVVLSRTYWALVLACVALTAAGAWWGAGAWAGGWAAFLALALLWVPDVVGTVVHNRRLTSSLDAQLRRLGPHQR
ncbi:hypothetical protein [Kineococcus sp. SYSU DK005]|uniref:hypothetical protein n=1 Tax=Kineococcus sp. SYSU DK005 TaxID=3383126 RepID=UPI003D7DF3D1